MKSKIDLNNLKDLKEFLDGDVLYYYYAFLHYTFPNKTIHIEANRDEQIGDVIITFWADTPIKP